MDVFRPLYHDELIKNHHLIFQEYQIPNPRRILSPSPSELQNHHSEFHFDDTKLSTEHHFRIPLHGNC